MNSQSQQGRKTGRRGGEAPRELKLGGRLRMTRQRREVYDVLMRERDHPTASEVFVRAKEEMPQISLATVYNCLETLTDAGLVKQVNMDRGPARYCPNLRDHAHFHCSRCGAIFDVPPHRVADMARIWDLPAGAEVASVEVVIKGVCPTCEAGGGDVGVRPASG